MFYQPSWSTESQAVCILGPDDVFEPKDQITRRSDIKYEQMHRDGDKGILPHACDLSW